MVADAIEWPRMLCPRECSPNPVPFTRSGGRSLGGVKKSVRTDLGYWSIAYVDVALVSPGHLRTWNAIRVGLSGESGLVIVPIWTKFIAPLPVGETLLEIETTHSDGTPFSDGSLYSQGTIKVYSDGVTEIGATFINLRIENALPNLSGVWFSYNHALYETGPASSISGDTWGVRIFPSVREQIPDGAELNFSTPTCLCHLASDREMDTVISKDPAIIRNVSFVEATDYWNEQAV
jgi:hypothetical protein